MRRFGSAFEGSPALADELGDLGAMEDAVRPTGFRHSLCGRGSDPVEEGRERALVRNFDAARIDGAVGPGRGPLGVSGFQRAHGITDAHTSGCGDGAVDAERQGLSLTLAPVERQASERVKVGDATVGVL